MPVETKFAVHISRGAGYLTGDPFPQGYKADGVQLDRLQTLGRLFPYLYIHYSSRANWGTRDAPKFAPMYISEVKFPMSVLYDGCLFGPGSGPCATLGELIAALWAWVMPFRSCGVFEPLSGSEGVYGPVTEEKRDRVRLFGVIPGRWPEGGHASVAGLNTGSWQRGRSLEAIVGLAKIGLCMRLCMPRGLGEPKLIPHPKWPCAWNAEETIPRPVADEMLASGLLGEFPEDTGSGSKIGWRDAGLPGDLYHVYAFVQ
jgi:hypothetical protein